MKISEDLHVSFYKQDWLSFGCRPHLLMRSKNWKSLISPQFLLFTIAAANLVPELSENRLTSNKRSAQLQ